MQVNYVINLLTVPQVLKTRYIKIKIKKKVFYVKENPDWDFLI